MSEDLNIQQGGNPFASNNYVRGSFNKPTNNSGETEQPPETEASAPQSETDIEQKFLENLNEGVNYSVEAFNADLAKLIASREELKQASLLMANTLTEPNNSNETLCSINQIIQSIIALTTALQGMAAAYSDKLKLLSKELEYYSIEMTQIPAGDSDNTRSQKYGNMLQILQSLKDRIEQQTKTVTGAETNMQDSYGSLDDYIGTFTNLLQQMAQQIMRS